MTKQRRPGTIEAALWRCKEILGIEQLADICGKSESMITRYLDIDDELRNLPAKYISAIDRACKEVNGETPLTSHLNRRLDSVNGAVGGCLHEAMFSATAANGKLSAILAKAISPTGPGGTRITNAEIAEFIEGIEINRRKLDKAEATARNYAKPNLKEVG